MPKIYKRTNDLQTQENQKILGAIYIYQTEVCYFPWLNLPSKLKMTWMMTY